jgi:predicted RNA binding protein YcfA (HicA-like mRNA interferase family)
MAGRLPPIPYDVFTKILKVNGFRYDRSKGGHEVWEKTITDSISIPVHGDINGGIARRLIKEHNLKR